jgi:putative Mg2+ transporter-C (MgtC) family protein
MLVALGAMMFSEVGRSFGGDPARVAAQVVTGVGFLGAGTIMRMGGEVKGLTTAASVWATAAIGMAVSSGGVFAIVAVAATVLVLLTLALVDDLQRRIVREPKQDILRLRTTSKACLPAIIDYLHEAGVNVRSSEIHSDEGEYEMVFEVEPRKAQALSVGAAVEDVKTARWSG